MDTRYLNFCSNASPFYSASSRANSWQLFEIPEAPRQWLRVRVDDWINWAPFGFVQRAQGWKLHISTTPTYAQTVLSRVASYLFNRGTVFKHIATHEELVNRNSKSANRASSGKFITIYPNNDKDFEEITGELFKLLAGMPGPYILSDIRLGNAPIFARYGSFLKLELFDSFDIASSAVIGENGLLLQDERRPFYRVPPEVIRPASVQRAEELATASQVSPLDEYERIEALSFSNGGGVYRSWRGKTSTILKEARPYAGLDRRGINAVSRRRTEWTNLCQLADDSIVPVPIRQFKAWEHTYIEMEDLGGVTLGDWAVETYPFSRSDDSVAFVRQAVEYSQQAVEAVRMAHMRGLVVGDVHPWNFMITDDNSLKLIDLEDNRVGDSTEHGGFNVFGYEPPEGLPAESQDWWALSRVIASLFHIVRPIEVLVPDYWEWSLDWIERKFGSEAVVLIRSVAALASPTSREIQFRPNSSIDISCITVAPTLETFRTTEFRQKIVAGIEQLSKHYGETYRPYPGDIAAIGKDTVSLTSPMYGALGVEVLLRQAGKPANDRLADLIVHGLRLGDIGNNGLLFGRMGGACLLASLDHVEDAETVAAYALRDAARRRRLDFGSGLAGVVYGGVALSEKLGNDELREATRLTAQRLSSAVTLGDVDLQTSSPAGLVTGRAGIALALTVAYTDFGVAEYAEQAVGLLRTELDRAVKHSGGRTYLLEDTSERALPYLNGGSAGALIAIAALVRAGLNDERILDCVPGLVEACASDVYAFGGLLNGRLGIISALEYVQATGLSDTATLVRRHVVELAQHLVEVDGELVLVGDQLLRVSLDLGTGSAGLLALSLQLDRGGLPWLPGQEIITELAFDDPIIDAMALSA